MCLLFGMLPPNVAYIGIVTCICTFVGLVMNMYYTRLLVPDIRLKMCYVHWIKVKELISAGIWNSISRLSQVLSDGLDLVITIIWISAYLMGELSIAQQIPTYISTLTNTLINLFSPNLTMYYAKDDTEAVVKELKLSMKFSSFFVNIIFLCTCCFGKYFVQLWVQTGCEPDLLITCSHYDESDGIRGDNILKQCISYNESSKGEFYLLAYYKFYQCIACIHLLEYNITWNLCSGRCQQGDGNSW